MRPRAELNRCCYRTKNLNEHSINLMIGGVVGGIQNFPMVNNC